MADSVLVKGLSILDPTTAPMPMEVSLALRPNTLTGKVLGLLDNAKPNAGKILDLVAEQVAKRYNLLELVRKRKPDPSRAAPQKMLDEIAEECHFAIVGVGD